MNTKIKELAEKARYFLGVTNEITRDHRFPQRDPIVRDGIRTQEGQECRHWVIIQYIRTSLKVVHIRECNREEPLDKRTEQLVIRD